MNIVGKYRENNFSVKTIIENIQLLTENNSGMI